ncbi:MAG: ABC transporter ATP-binding protein [Candidatus Kariarchaeaceae archaeon]|jgi:putative ABC transport system ATP-binding protein
MNKNEIIIVENLTKHFNLNSNEIHALKDISFSIDKSEFVGLLGPSGCGKTTLINCLSGLLSPTSGRIRINGTEITELTHDQVRNYRLKNIGLVFQEHLLVNSLTAAENITLPLIFGRVPLEERKNRSVELLNILGLSDKMNNLPEELSGGEQQRVGIGRALVYNPKLLLADEPTGDLDTRSGQLVLQTFRKIVESGDTSIIVVSHDPRHRIYFDRILEMNDGRLEEV